MSFVSTSIADQRFVSAKTAAEVLAHLETLPQDTVVLLDVDDTLITPVSKTFRTTSAGTFPTKNLIDEIKNNKDEYPHFESIVSSWRLQRQVRLTDTAWPTVLETLKKKYQVYALTQMNTGQFGTIPSMEAWRYKELKSLGLTFSQPSSALSKNHDQEAALLEKDSPVFYQGIMITGNKSKSTTIDTFQNQFKTSTLVMVDDRQKHLDDIGAFCKDQGMGFVGILYAEASTKEDLQDIEIYNVQKKTLIEKSIWLEDDEARQHLSLQN